MSEKHPFYCEHCERYGFRPATVDGVIVKDDKVLLLERVIEPEKGTWTLPCGFVKLKDTAEAAVIREAKEETGLDCQIERLVGVFSAPNRDIRHCITSAYILNIIGGNYKVNQESRKLA